MGATFKIYGFWRLDVENMDFGAHLQKSQKKKKKKGEIGKKKNMINLRLFTEFRALNLKIRKLGRMNMRNIQITF